MSTSRWLLFLLALLGSTACFATEPTITLVEGKESVTVQADGKDIATYVYKHKELTRPGFINVHSFSGTPVTRTFPPKGSEDADHALFHPGIWVSFGDINGHDYWRQKARVEHERFVKDPTADQKRSFSIRNRYVSTDGKATVCLETTRFTFLPASTGWWLIWESTFESDQDLTFGLQEENGLGVRIASPLRVKGGKGTIRNSKGDENEKGTWGEALEWLDYAGPLGERTVGVFLAPDPANGRECWAHSRDYGVMVCNTFPRPGSGGKAFVVKKGEKLHLAFGVLIHDTPAKEPLDGKAAYQEFLDLRKKKP